MNEVRGLLAQGYEFRWCTKITIKVISLKCIILKDCSNASFSLHIETALSIYLYFGSLFSIQRRKTSKKLEECMKIDN